MKKIISKGLIFLLTLNLVFSSLLSINVGAMVLDNLDINITMNKTEFTGGEEVTFKIEYRVKGDLGGIKDGDSFSVEIPGVFKDIKLVEKPIHVKEVKIKNNIVTAVFGGDKLEGAIGGYIELKAIVKEVLVESNEKVTIIINGKEFEFDLVVKPKPDIPTKDDIKKIVTNLKIKDGEYIIYKPSKGKKIDYTIEVNGKLGVNRSFKVYDNVDNGMELIKNSVKIIKIENQKEIDVTRDFKDKILINGNKLEVNFENISNKYIVRYSTIINEEKVLYKNIATININEEEIKSEAIIKPVDKPQIPGEEPPINNGEIPKNPNMHQLFRKNSYNPAMVGEKVHYDIIVNEGKLNAKNLILRDEIPNGMELLEEGFKIEEEHLYYYDNGVGGLGIGYKFIDVTKDFKKSGKIKINGNTFEVNFGDTWRKYRVTYFTKVLEAKEEYKNIAVLNYDTRETKREKIVSYYSGAGAINVKKSSDKNKLVASDNNVTYSIDIDSYGFFNSGYLKISDELDSRIKILNIEYPEDYFKVDINNNEVKIENIKKIIYGESFHIKIHTSFENVSAGTTIENKAKINDNFSNSVQVKKGYKFIAKKVDNTIRNGNLPGAEFVLRKVENTKYFKLLTSDKDGIIEAELEEPGEYTLKETRSPEGYILTDKSIEFVIKEDDIGKVVELPSIDNTKIRGGFKIIKKNSLTNEPLAGAYFVIKNETGEMELERATDVNGEIFIGNLPYGKYTYQEVKAPEGYVPDENIYEFNISDLDVIVEKVMLNNKIYVEEENKDDGNNSGSNDLSNNEISPGKGSSSNNEIIGK